MCVLISGAGVAGPTAAWFLAKAGARFTVVEKAQSLLPHGQSVDIEGSAVGVIQRMGLLDEVRRHNTTEKGMRFIDSRGRPFAPFPVKQDGFGVSATSELEILRGDLAKILYDATKDFTNVEYLFDTTMRQVVSNDDSSVGVELSTSAQREFDVLIAADGQWSRIRKQCFPKDAVSVDDRGMYAVYWTMPRQADDNEWWNIFQALDSRVITTRPDPYGTMRTIFTCLSRDDALRQRLLDSMADAPDLYFQSIKQIIMTKWHSGRVVCFGDTAYCPTPTSGMGTTPAIMGAYVHAGELGKLKDSEHPIAAFEAHERVYRPVINELQPVPKVILRIVHANRAWKRWLFQTAVSMLSRIIALQWVASRLESTGENIFPLPEYSAFEKQDSA